MVILVTGTSSGFGLAIRRHLISKGHKVYGSSRTADLSDPYILAIDVRDAASAQLAIDKVIEREGSIDVLINNAGIVMAGPIELLDIKKLKEQFDVNTFGAVAVTQKFIPLLKDGKIINISAAEITKARKICRESINPFTDETIRLSQKGDMTMVTKEKTKVLSLVK